MPRTASWRLLLLHRCIYPVLPHWCLPPLSWSHQLTLQTWILTHPHRKKLQRLQSGECRGQENSNSYKMILSPLSKFRMVYQHWAVAPSCCQTMTWPVTNELLPAKPDHERIYQRYWWHQCCPACFFHHPFHNQPLSIHEPNKLMLSPCYSSVSNKPPYLRDTMAPRRRHIFNRGLGWKGYLFLPLSRSGARRFCLQMVRILSTFWHLCRLEISQC